MYEQRIARFLSEDPLKSVPTTYGSTSDSLSSTRNSPPTHDRTASCYSYAMNSPSQFVDPSGFIVVAIEMTKYSPHAPITPPTKVTTYHWFDTQEEANEYIRTLNSENWLDEQPAPLGSDRVFWRQTPLTGVAAALVGECSGDPDCLRALAEILRHYPISTGHGNFVGSHHSITFRVCSNKDCNTLRDEIFKSLASFEHFNRGVNTMATVELSDDGSIARFDMLGISGRLSDQINADKVPVRIEVHDRSRLVEGTTLHGHMLEGKRFWAVSVTSGPFGACDVSIVTWAFERKVGLLNDIGARMPFVGGTERQMLVWDQYLINLRNAYGGLSCEGLSTQLPKPIHFHWNTRSKNYPRSGLKERD